MTPVDAGEVEITQLILAFIILYNLRRTQVHAGRPHVSQNKQESNGGGRNVRQVQVATKQTKNKFAKV